MFHKSINLVKLLKGYNSGWVGLSSKYDRVLYHEKTLKETIKKASQTKEKVVFFPAGESYSNFVG